MRSAENDQQQDWSVDPADLLEHAPGAIMVTSGSDHRISLVNAAHRSLFRSDDWACRRLLDVMTDGGDRLAACMNSVYRTGKPSRLQPMRVPAGSTSRDVDATRFLAFMIAPLHDQSGAIKGVFCEGVDISEMGWAQSRELALAELGECIREIDDADDLAYAAVAILGRELGASRAGYGRIDIARETIAIERDWNAPGIKSLRGVLSFRDFGTFFEELRRGRTVICVDAKTDPRTQHHANALQAISARSFVNLPLTEQGGFVALLYLNHATVRSWTDDELAFIKEVAERTRTAVERRRAEAAVRANEARLRFLDSLAKETAKSRDADTIMAVTTRMVGEHLGVDVCAYADMEPDQDHFTIRGDWSAPGSASIVGHYSLKDFGHLAVTRLQAGLPLVLHDNQAELPPKEAATFLDIGLAATVCMPLVKEERLTALMAIHSAVPRQWKVQEQKLLREVTERSWAHIERVRSEAAVRQAEQRFREELEAQVVERTAALQQSETNIRTIFESSHLYQGLLGVDGTVLYANATSLAGIRARREEVIGMPLWQTPWFTGTPGVSKLIQSAFAKTAAGVPTNHQLTLNLPIGVRTFDFSLRPVQNEAGEVVAIVPEAVDTTARLKAEQALRQAHKMEAIGNLTGGIAHDFNNLLMAICGSLELLRKRMPQDPTLLRLLDNAMAATSRGTSLIRRMLAFARRQDLKTERIDVEQLVRDMTELLQRSLGPTINLQTSFEDHLPLVETDVNQFESALLNLAVNARDAMNGEGHIAISGRIALVEEGKEGLVPGRYVCISIADDGEGMDEATLARAAEPFFTTKGVGKGTGLGLSMVQGLVEQSGGRLRLKSAPGSGTTVDIWLPAVAGEDRRHANIAPMAPPAAPLAALRPLTVLAVDDDALVLMNTAAMLEDLGHHVVTAASGEEALAKADDPAVDLVVTDQAMPRMTGAQLAKELRVRRPGLPIVIATGYAELPAGVGGNLPRLSKPFSQAELARVMQRAVRAPDDGESVITDRTGEIP